MPILLEDKIFVVKISRYDLIFWRLCHWHGKNKYSQLRKNIREKSDSYFCSASNGGPNGVWRSEKSFKTREEIGLQGRWLTSSSACSCQNYGTQSSYFLKTKNTWLDSVFDRESKYVKFKKLQQTEEDEISSFLMITQTSCVFGAPSILKISPSKLDQNRIKRWYSESAQRDLSEYVAFNKIPR